MIIPVGDNIISSLGFSSEENYIAVKNGISGLQQYDPIGKTEPFVASCIDKKMLDEKFASIAHSTENYTLLEKAAILSAYSAASLELDLSSPDVKFFISTTKGNVHLLEEGEFCDDLYLWHTANKIVGFFENKNCPMVISNACISGANAQITAWRELETEACQYAVVIGIDMISKFIVSGFQSFKALAPKPCRPFDVNRCGLNLGEAAATIIYRKAMPTDMSAGLVRGSIRNDANHISGPSRTGEGCYLAIKDVLQDVSPNDIAFINAHGTATPYNDAMEAVAINRAGLQDVPVYSLKGYFGHTLGAAGVLESIISTYALNDSIIPASCSFSSIAPDCQVNVNSSVAVSSKPYYLKLLSGFGGCNAALLFKKGFENEIFTTQADLSVKRYAYIDNSVVDANGEEMSNKNGLNGLYRSLGIDYPKFFKMDKLSKLGFLASEFVFENNERPENMSVICFNSSSSLDTDRHYQTTIKEDNYFPSPSVFVYTLPNIVAGEIAIRNKFTCETSFYISESIDFEMIERTVKNSNVDSALVLWTDYLNNKYKAFALWLEKHKDTKTQSFGKGLAKLAKKTQEVE